jgi:signal transduction histidine kinase
VRQDQPVLLPGSRSDQLPLRPSTAAGVHGFVSALAFRLEYAQSPDELLAATAELIAAYAGVPFAAIEVEHARLGSRTATWGVATGNPFTVPLTYQGVAAGCLRVTGGAPGRPVGRRERRVLVELSPHLGAVLHTTRLLGAARQGADRVLYARERERRRLRQELHDSLGPILAGISLGLHAAQRVMRRDPHRAEQLVGHLEGELQSAMAEVRRLFETLRPAVLDQVGLAAAVREQIEVLGTRMRTDEESPRDVSFSFVHDGDFAALPAVVEVAAYRIVCEALTNVVRHSRASRCSVSLRRSDVLRLEIVDDGIGIGISARRGVGLGSMRERADELGGVLVVDSVPAGGTRVTATLPIQPDPDAPRGARSGEPVPVAAQRA